MKIQNCKVCGKTVPEESLSMECPDCYIKGAKIEREKALAEVNKIIDEIENVEKCKVCKGYHVTNLKDFIKQLKQKLKELKGEELKFPKVHGRS